MLNKDSPKKSTPEKFEEQRYGEKEVSGWDWAKQRAGYILGGLALLYGLVVYHFIEARIAWVIIGILVIYIIYQTKIYKFALGKKEYELPDPLGLADKVSQYLLERKGYRTMFLKVVGDPELGASSHTPNVLHLLFARLADEAYDFGSEQDFAGFVRVKVSVFDWKNKSFGVIDIDSDWVGSETLRRSWFGGLKYPTDERLPVYQPSAVRVALPEREEEEEARQYYEEE